MSQKPDPEAPAQQGTPRKRPRPVALVLGVLLGSVFPLALCGGLYSCSVAPRKATEAYFAAVRAGSPPYALQPDDAVDAEQALVDVKRSSGFSLWNFQERSDDGWTRSCLLVRLNLPDGARWMDVALDKHGETWRVRDLSFERDCNTAKHRGDFRLRR